ncbi:hypothetical protein GA0074692_1894 [Micromonospora pallida]|uniref:Uncharacterized protein n=1 Tax=Micromonospora pallida TaxID=145854 RepID=A0A1C6S6K4_9ACTN|nr:hypothetical protein [Micromonospora pallida]SCL25092.1 hypothetical protein GA0074692_1894 [Micromonospora pallida]
MKRRIVRNDPISTGERDRGAVIVKMLLDLDRAVPAARPQATNADRSK